MYNTPGVYVEEISTFPPSVAEVATAIPAFIGYTELGAAASVKVAQINTLLEYEQAFGKPRPTAFATTAAGVVKPLASNLPATPLWYAVNLYFQNGGGRCYVVSVDSQDSAPAADRYLAGLAALEAEDEPTLIVMPGAVALAQADFNSVGQAALAHCKKLGDRFAILDVKGGDVAAFRDGIGAANLLFGAAYHPYIKTSLVHAYDEATVMVDGAAPPPPATPPPAGTPPPAPPPATTLASLKTGNTALYNTIKTQLADQRIELPAERGDGRHLRPRRSRARGVEGPGQRVAGLGDRPDGADHQRPAGAAQHRYRRRASRSTRSARSPARGIMVWGARTLAGNDNEWRYINVRRLFIMIEESAKKSTAFAVFEANDASTWLKVKGMLESYLYGLWEQGALAGIEARAGLLRERRPRQDHDRAGRARRAG